VRKRGSGGKEIAAAAVVYPSLAEFCSALFAGLHSGHGNKKSGSVAALNHFGFGSTY